MTGARERDAAEDRRTGAGVRERDDAEAAAEAGESARTEPSGAPVPAKARPVQGGPTATDPEATAGAVAADPVAVADPVAPAPGTPASPASGPLPPASADDDGRGTGRPLLAPGERDELGERLHRATGRFVDDPPGAVDDACAVLGDLGERVAALLAERRDTCRDLSRRARGAEGAENAETERLRLALRDSRDLAELLLKL